MSSYKYKNKMPCHKCQDTNVKLQCHFINVMLKCQVSMSCWECQVKRQVTMSCYICHVKMSSYNVSKSTVNGSEILGHNKMQSS